MATVQESFLCANTDHHKLHQKSKSGHVAPFDDQPNGHSFGLINEFLLCQYEDADYFHADSVMADSSASAKPKGHTLHSVGLGSDSGDGYSFVFTRRWTAGNRPASATDNNGTLFVIAVRHRDDCDKFEVDFKFNTRPLALMSSMMSYEIDESAKSRSARRQNVALVLNIPDSILQRQLLSVGATSISLGKDVIPLAAECHFTLQKADSLHDKGFRHDAFSVAKIPGTVKEALLPRGALGSYRDLNKTKLVSCTFGGTPVEAEVVSSLETESEFTVSYATADLSVIATFIADLWGAAQLDTEQRQRLERLTKTSSCKVLAPGTGKLPPDLALKFGTSWRVCHVPRYWRGFEETIS